MCNRSMKYMQNKTSFGKFTSPKMVHWIATNLLVTHGEPKCFEVYQMFKEWVYYCHPSPVRFHQSEWIFEATSPETSSDTTSHHTGMYSSFTKANYGDEKGSSLFVGI